MADLDITITDVGYAEAMRRLKGFAPKLRTELRKQINAEAKVLLAAQRKAVINATVSGSGSAKRGPGYSAREAHALGKRKVGGPLTLKQSQTLTRGAGLRVSVARTLRVINRDQQRDPGVRVEAERGRLPGRDAALPAALERGHWVHPTYGHRDQGRMIPQSISPPGWFFRTAEHHLPKIRNAIKMAVTTARDAT